MDAQAGIDEKTIEKLKADNPGTKLVQLEGGGETVIVRAPSRPEYMRFRAQLDDDQKKRTAIEHLFRAVVLYPDSNAVDAMLERKPALAVSFGSEVLELAGMMRSIEKKEL